MSAVLRVDTDQTPQNADTLHYLPGPEVLKLFFILISIEHEIFSANKYLNANNCWHFNIY